MASPLKYFCNQFSMLSYIYLYRLEEVVSPEADAVEQIETELVAACNIFHPSVVVVETIADVRSQRYLVRYAEGDSRDYEYAEPILSPHRGTVPV